MRKTLTFVLTLAVAVAAIPAGLFAAVKAGAAQELGSLNGVAQTANRVMLPNHIVQVRDVVSGRIVSSTTSSQSGAFSFTGLQPGSYVVEVIDAAGKVMGLSAPVPVSAGVAAQVTVTLPASGAMAAGGGGLLGLGKAASIAAIAATAGLAAATVAVVATQDDASPSR